MKAEFDFKTKTVMLNSVYDMPIILAAYSHIPEPNANVLEDGLYIGDSSADNPDAAVTEWLGQMGVN